MKVKSVRWYLETWDPRVKQWIVCTLSTTDYERVTAALRRLQNIGLKCRIRKEQTDDT